MKVFDVQRSSYDAKVLNSFSSDTSGEFGVVSFTSWSKYPPALPGDTYWNALASIALGRNLDSGLGRGANRNKRNDLWILVGLAHGVVDSQTPALWRELMGMFDEVLCNHELFGVHKGETHQTKDLHWLGGLLDKYEITPFWPPGISGVHSRRSQ